MSMNEREYSQNVNLTISLSEKISTYSKLLSESCKNWKTPPAPAPAPVFIQNSNSGSGSGKNRRLRPESTASLRLLITSAEKHAFAITN